MICQWDALMRIVPKWMRSEVDKLGAGSLQELRLRLGGPPILVRKSSVCSLDQSITPEDLSFVIHSASQYSPNAPESISGEESELTVSFVDAFLKLIKTDIENAENFFVRLEKLAVKHNVKFVISVNVDDAIAPEFLKKYFI